MSGDTTNIDHADEVKVGAGDNLAGAMKHLQETTGPRGSASIVLSNRLPRKAFVCRDGEEVAEFDLEAPLRQGLLETVSDVAAYADSDLAPKPEVYVSTGRVVVVCDGDKRDEGMTLRLVPTSVFERLTQMRASPRGMSVRDLVRYLRLQLGVTDEDLLAKLGRVDFSRKSDGRQRASHGSEGLGREVEAEVQNIESIPKSFPLSVQPFRPAGARVSVPVQMTVFVDVHEEQVVLAPAPDELERARDEAAEAVYDSLREQLPEGTPLFRGTLSDPSGDLLGNA